MKKILEESKKEYEEKERIRKFYLEAGLDPNMEDQDQIGDDLHIHDDNDIKMRESSCRR